MSDGDAGGDADPGIPREEALAIVESIIETIESEEMPVPVRELWVYGDVALGLDPVERLDVYLAKDILMGATADPERSAEFKESMGVDGIGKTVWATWADTYPEFIRANDNGHAAPEKCLAAHLLPDGKPVHLEVCNTGFEDNVTQRLKGAMAREAYHEILDPRGVCLWVDGRTSEDALSKLKNAELPFPKLSDALAMLGVDEDEAEVAAKAVHDYRSEQEGATVRGDVV